MYKFVYWKNEKKIFEIIHNENNNPESSLTQAVVLYIEWV